MSFFRHTSIGVILSLVLVCADAPSLAQSFTEDFNTTTFRDTATTADWNTSAGELRLFPFNPSVVATVPLSQKGWGVFAAGDHAYVADGASGVKIVDITDPAAPVVIGTYDTSGDARAVWVGGGLTYVADGTSGLQILDASDPTSPSLVGTYDTPSFAWDVEVCGSFAYVPDLTTFQVIDVSNPSAPVLAGTYNTSGVACGVDISGRHAFVADDSGGLYILDITDPTSPALAGLYTGTSRVQDVVVAGTSAYLAAYLDGLHIVDVTDVTAPVFLNGFGISGLTGRVAVDGDVAYLTSTVSDLVIADVTDPLTPSQIAAIPIAGAAKNAAAWGNYVYVPNDGPGLDIVEVRVPANPAVIGTLTLSSGTGGVSVSGDLGAAVSNGVTIFDLSDPTAPSVLGNLPGLYSRLAISGDRIYAGTVGAAPFYVHSIDISDPANPVLDALYTLTNGTVRDIAVCGELVYATLNTSAQFQIFESNPGTTPDTLQIVGSVTLTSPGSFVIDGQFAYVDDDDDLVVIDVSDPSIPSIVTTLSLPGIDEMAVTGGLLVAVESWAGGWPNYDSGAGIYTIDVRDPASPVLLDSYGRSDVGFWSVAVTGDVVYVPGSDALRIFEVSNPADIVLVETVGAIGGIILAGDHAYAPSDSGLSVLAIAERSMVATDNRASSTVLSSSAQGIVRASLSTSQTDSVAWRVSNDNGATWITSSPDGSWHRFGNYAVLGSELKWESSLFVATPGVSPVCGSLQIEWRTEAGTITAVEDVPDDQGGWARLRFRRSGFDFAEESIEPLSYYFVQRRFEDPAAMATGGLQTVGTTTPKPEMFHAWPDDAPLFEWRGRYFTIEEHSRGDAASAVAWEFVTSLPALNQDEYVVLVPTLQDSTDGASPSVYRFITQAQDGTFFYSDPDSGHSLDNIAPGVPQNLVVAYNTGSGNQLSWDPSDADDFQYFKVYRDTDPAFTPSPSNEIQTTASTSWEDPEYDGWNVYYKITALDYAGNESDPASTGSVTASDGPADPDRFALHANVPNPFNPSTVIHYDVPAGGAYVKLAIYDVRGSFVTALVDGLQTAGRKRTSWDGRDARGRRVSSGVYFYRLTSGDFASTRKMLLLK